MAIRSPELGLVIDELRPGLLGARLQEVRVPAPDRVVLSFHAAGDTSHLLLVAQSVHARVHRVGRPPPNPRQSLSIQGRLRQLLHGSCTALDQLGDDRILRLGLGELSLVGELTGRHGNLFILDAEDRVVVSLLPNRSFRRDLSPGQLYQPPASAVPRPRDARFEPPDVSGQLERHYGELEKNESLQRSRAPVLRRLRAVERKLARKAERQEREAGRGDDAEALRREADLLNASFGRLRRGMSTIELPDLFDPEGTPVVLELDPARSPREQIDRRYRRARRLERGMVRAAEECLRTLEDLDEARHARATIEAASNVEDVERLVESLPRRWRPQAAPQRRKSDAPRPPYRTFRTPSGREIRVGRSAADNDLLTFRHARGRDIWMHVVGRPGSHVVVPGANIDPLDLEIAAQLALAHSGLKEGDTGEVAWTRVKYVRKVKRSPPGRVTYSQERTMFVKRRREALEGVEVE